jgi:hypothetical protein
MTDDTKPTLGIKQCTQHFAGRGHWARAAIGAVLNGDEEGVPFANNDGIAAAVFFTADGIVHVAEEPPLDSSHAPAYEVRSWPYTALEGCTLTLSRAGLEALTDECVDLSESTLEVRGPKEPHIIVSRVHVAGLRAAGARDHVEAETRAGQLVLEFVKSCTARDVPVTVSAGKE